MHNPKPIAISMDECNNYPLNISILNSAEVGGGAESCVRMLCEGLTNQGHQATLWVGRAGSQSGEATTTRVIPVADHEKITASRFARKGFFGLGIETSHDFARSEAFESSDIIHLHNVHGHYFSLEAIPLLAKRAALVWTLHDFFAITGGCAFPFTCDRWKSNCGSCPQLGNYPMVTKYDRTRRMLSLKRNLFRSLPVTIVTPSEHLGRAVKESGMFKRAEYRIIPYGVDTDIFKPARESSRQKLGLDQNATVVTLIAQGLDDPRKGLSHAVEALSAVVDPQLTILLIGAGETNSFKEALNKHQVVSLGYLTDRRELACALAAADLFLFTSLAENFPCVVQEAMACGAAVTSFNINGVIEQIQQDQTGFLVPAGETPALARHLRELLPQKARLCEVGNRAYQHAQSEWTVKQFIESHEALYHQIQPQYGTTMISMAT